MKMIIAILRDHDCDPVIQGLTEKSFRVTRIASTGGWLRRGTGTLLMGVQDDRVDMAIEVVRAKVSPASGEEKRATIFVVPVENFQQI
jgi:uncharacterized protein YaaQ